MARVSSLLVASTLFAVVGAASACGDTSPAPPANDDLAVVLDLGGGVDLSMTSPDDGGVPVDPTPDLSGIPSPGDLGGAGASCTTACDCSPGLACLQSQCVAGVQPVYCCDQPAASCPTGAVCERAAGGYRTCGGGGGGGAVDLGTGNLCRLVPCNLGGTARCVQVGCTMCVAGTLGMVCSR